jgi:hypothetical protein
MKKKYLLLSFVVICALSIISTTNVNSHLVFPPLGYCGDPTGIPAYVTCATQSCHGGSAQAINSSNLSIQIGTDSTSLSTLDNTFKYVPNQTYFISFSVLASGYAWGFEMTALNQNTSMAGTFTRDNTITEHLSPGPPYYISHLYANHNTSSWKFLWTAPATDSAVTFYYAFNSSDSADFTADVPDHNIFAGTTTIAAQGVGINEISNNISELQVYPNPINGAFNLAFDALQPGNASAMLYSVDGKLCRQLFNENLSSGSFNRNYNIATLAEGIYLLKMNVNGATVTKKIVKE